MATRTCPACAGTDTGQVQELSVHAQHLAYADGDVFAANRLNAAFSAPGGRYTVLRCQRCHLEFADPALAPPVDWYAALYDQLDLYPTARWEYGVVAAALAARDAVVDYGCGNGHFLALVKPRVRATHGFDFAHGSIKQAAAKGIDAHVLDLDGQCSGASLALAADHVVAFHVLEHLANPQTLFSFADQVAAPNGRLWVAVPSDRRASRTYGEADALDSPPHHLTRWSEPALRALGERCGWVLARHAYEPLPQRLAVWESTRRLALYRDVQPPTRWLERLYRRALAAGVWATGRHRRSALSGFSMLACFLRRGAEPGIR